MTAHRKTPVRRQRKPDDPSLTLAQMQQGDLDRAAAKDAARKARRAQQSPKLNMVEDFLTQQQAVLDACPEVAAVQVMGVLSKPDAHDPNWRSAVMALPKTTLARK